MTQELINAEIAIKKIRYLENEIERLKKVHKEQIEALLKVNDEFIKITRL